MPETLTNLITNAPELRVNELRCPYGIRRIFKAEVQTVVNLADKCWATLIGTPTYGYHIVPMLTEIFLNAFRCVTGNVNPNFSHCLYRLWIDPWGWYCSGGMNIEPRIIRLQKAVGHLTAAAVAGAKNQYLHNIQLNK